MQSVKFDHIAEPYCVERVKSKFMLMKAFYVHRKQFPLILAYVVKIHKCQGLSLDSAIIDLSKRCSVQEWHMWLYLECVPLMVCILQTLI